MNNHFTEIPRRLLMTADTVGGVWTYAVELARSLEPYGVEIQLATMGALPNPQQLEEARQIANLSLFKSEYRLEWMEDPWRDVRRAGDWLLHLERRLRPDLVHLNNFVHAALPWRAPKLVVGHSCVLSWWQAVRGGSVPAGWAEYRRKVTEGLRAADLVAAPSREMLSALERHYGALPNKRVVPNGRDAALFPPGRKEDFIFAAGRIWDEAKNIAAVARMAARLPVPVFVAGDEKHPDGGCAQFDNVRLLGRLSAEALAGWYARASIFVLPARYEPFGLAALEAALAGCALVLGDIPSLREIWNESALLVDPDDEEALAGALASLTTDRSRREELAHKARARALEFNCRRMAEHYVAAYSDLLTGAVKAVRQKEEALCTW